MNIVFGEHVFRKAHKRILGFPIVIITECPPCLTIMFPTYICTIIQSYINYGIKRSYHTKKPYTCFKFKSWIDNGHGTVVSGWSVAWQSKYNYGSSKARSHCHNLQHTDYCQSFLATPTLISWLYLCLTETSLWDKLHPYTHRYSIPHDKIGLSSSCLPIKLGADNFKLLVMQTEKWL